MFLPNLLLSIFIRLCIIQRFMLSLQIEKEYSLLTTIFITMNQQQTRDSFESQYGEDKVILTVRSKNWIRKKLECFENFQGLKDGKNSLK